MPHLTEAESLAKYGTVAYTAWDAPSAQQDWLAKNPQAAPQTGATTTPTQKQPQTASELLSAITAPQTGYDEAAKAVEAKLPLIQQRYKTLLDEISQSVQAGTTAEQQATTGQISETQARAGAMGTFYGTTELGTEENLRKRAADTIAQINLSGANQTAKAIAQQAIEEGQVTTDLANLGIQKDAASRATYTTALDYILKKQQYDYSLGAAGGGTLGAQMDADIQSGMYLKDVLTKYGAQVGPQIIYQRYNQQSPFGAAGESVTTLAQWGIKAPTPTTNKWQMKSEKGLFNLTTTDYLFNPATGAKIKVVQGGSVNLQNPDTGENVSVIVGSPAFNTAISEGYFPI